MSDDKETDVPTAVKAVLIILGILFAIFLAASLIKLIAWVWYL